MSRDVKYTLDDLPPAPPLSDEVKAMTDDDVERRAKADPDAGAIPDGLWDRAVVLEPDGHKGILAFQAAVEAAQDTSKSEAVSDGLQLSEPQEGLHPLEAARLKQAYAEGMATGEGRPLNSACLLKDLKSGSGNTSRTR